MARSLRRLLPLLLGAACLVFVAACGDDNDDSGSSSSESTPAAAPPATTESTPAQTDTSGGGAGATIDVTAEEPGSPTPFAFKPKELEATAGKVSFAFDNPAGNQAPHALEIEGNGVEEETDTLMPGSKATLDVDLKPGKYTFYCPVGDHRSEGMEGTLVVK